MKCKMLMCQAGWTVFKKRRFIKYGLFCNRYRNMWWSTLSKSLYIVCEKGCTMICQHYHPLFTLASKIGFAGWASVIFFKKYFEYTLIYIYGKYDVLDGQCAGSKCFRTGYGSLILYFQTLKAALRLMQN